MGRGRETSEPPPSPMEMPGSRDLPTPEEGETTIQVEDYRRLGIALFEKKRYSEAIDELSKAAGASPGDARTSHYLFRAHLERGLQQLKRRSFMAAKTHFESALAHNGSCDACRDHIEKCVKAYLKRHYDRGLAYFRREKIAEAIRHWRRVHDLDPGYRDVRAKLKRATKLLERR